MDYLKGIKFRGYLILQQKIHCVFVDISECVALFSRHTLDVKEDISL